MKRIFIALTIAMMFLFSACTDPSSMNPIDGEDQGLEDLLKLAEGAGYNSSMTGAEVQAELNRCAGRNTAVADPGSDAELVTEQAVREALNLKEGSLTNEAGLYSALSDVTQFVEPGDAVTLLDATNWRFLYSNGSGDITEAVLGADGTFLESNGSAAAPGFRALADGDIPAEIARDSEVAALQADDLVTLSGREIGSTHLDTFTGTTITDSSTVKVAMQELETSLETKETANATVSVGKTGSVQYLTTDYASDAIAIQAAIDYVTGIGGGSVWLREGVYTIDESINMKDSVCLVGGGKASALTVESNIGVDINVISVDTVNDWAIKDIKIDGQRATQTAGSTRSIHLGACENGVISGVSMVDNYGVEGDGVFVDFNEVPVNISIVNNYINNIQDDGLDINTIADSKINGNTIDGCGGNGVDTESTKNCMISNNVITNCGMSGIELEDEKYTLSRKNTVMGNVVSDCATGIYLNSGAYNTIVGNVLIACTIGVEIRTERTPYYSVGNIISGNKFYSCTSGVTEEDGNQIENSILNNSFELTTNPIVIFSYNLVMNNFITNAGELQEIAIEIRGDHNNISGNNIKYCYDGIYVGGHYNNITNNMILGDGIDNYKGKYGIRLGKDYDYDSGSNFVAHNTIRDLTDSHIRCYAVDEAGADTTEGTNNDHIINNVIDSLVIGTGLDIFTRGNIGFTTEGDGIATLVNGTTSIAVTHSLDRTPSGINVTPIEAWGSMTSFWVDSITSTQFTIHSNADPGQDVDFTWGTVQ